jgi:GNAT superfamily N-acetyltransferase
MTDPKKKAAVTIRYAQPGDNHLLAELGARTFYETFAADNTPENMAAYLAKNFGPEQQADEIADPSLVILIAEVEGNAVGFAALRMGARQEGITGARPIELKQIYSLKEWIGHGIGATLMQASLDEAQRRGHDSIWLGVWERNPRAIAFYQKWGFVEIGSTVFVVGDDRQRDLLMQRSWEFIR